MCKPGELGYEIVATTDLRGFRESPIAFGTQICGYCSDESINDVPIQSKAVGIGT